MAAGRRLIILSTTVVAMALLAVAVIHRPKAAPPGPAAVPLAVPVAVTTVARRDNPEYASGIGTVQAWQTIALRPQVSGTLQAVNFKEGQDVRQGDLLALVDPRPYAAALAQAQARLAGDKATEVNAQVTLRRDTALARNDFASRQQVDADTAQEGSAAAAIQGDQAAIQAAQLNLDYCRITAPADGVIGFRQVDQGNLVTADSTQPIATITQVRPIAVVFTLAQEALPRVVAAMAAGRVEVQALNGDTQTPPGAPLATGFLVTPNNSIDASTGTIALKAEFPNADRTLWPGQFVTARILLATARNAVTVPLPAVQHGPDGLYAYVVRPDRTVERRPLSVGYQDDQAAEVTKGLNGGETLVVDGQSRLQDGTRVDPHPAAVG